MGYDAGLGAQHVLHLHNVLVQQHVQSALVLATSLYNKSWPATFTILTWVHSASLVTLGSRGKPLVAGWHPALHG